MFTLSEENCFSGDLNLKYNHEVGKWILEEWKVLRLVSKLSEEFCPWEDFEKPQLVTIINLGLSDSIQLKHFQKAVKTSQTKTTHSAKWYIKTFTWVKIVFTSATCERYQLCNYYKATHNWQLQSLQCKRLFLDPSKVKPAPPKSRPICHKIRQPCSVQCFITFWRVVCYSIKWWNIDLWVLPIFNNQIDLIRAPRALGIS